MPLYLNRLQVKPFADMGALLQAWDRYACALISSGLAEEVGPLRARVPQQDDALENVAERDILCFVLFRDRAQAFAAQEAHDDPASEIAQLYNAVMCFASENVTTCWNAPMQPTDALEQKDEVFRRWRDRG